MSKSEKPGLGQNEWHLILASLDAMMGLTKDNLVKEKCGDLMEYIVKKHGLGGVSFKWWDKTAKWNLNE